MGENFEDQDVVKCRFARSRSRGNGDDQLLVQLLVVVEIAVLNRQIGSQSGYLEDAFVVRQVLKSPSSSVRTPWSSVEQGGCRGESLKPVTIQRCRVWNRFNSNRNEVCQM